MIAKRFAWHVGAVLAVAVMTAAGVVLVAQPGADRYVVPATIRNAVLNELSGEQAHLHVQMLAGNRNRPASEYQEAFFETTYLRDMAKQYGLSDVQVDFFEGGETWDAEEGDLWLIEPMKRKIASLEMVPAALASGSTNAEVETGVVYVGAAREADFAGKEVKGKIVLGNASVGAVFNAAIPRGAIGVLGIGSPGLNANAAGYNLDQIGWASVRTRADRQGFGFALSLRQFTELQRFFERGQKVVMRAHVRSKTYPGRMNVVSATIPGTDPTAGELMLVAHSFETVATPGANDNCTGVGTIMEVGRTLARLIRDGTLPRPRRTIRLLWGPEISGTTAFMFENAELQDKLIAALNFDMTGANPKTTDTYLRMKMTPDSRPSYLNALVGNLLLFADQTEILTQQGANAQFNYRMAHLAAITSGSDHSVFLAAGIPAMQFNYWPDNFYHSSEDRVAHAGPHRVEARRRGRGLRLLLPRECGRLRGPGPGVGGRSRRREVDHGGDAAEPAAAGRRRFNAARPIQGGPEQGGLGLRACQGRRRVGPLAFSRRFGVGHHQITGGIAGGRAERQRTEAGRSVPRSRRRARHQAGSDRPDRRRA